MDGKACKVVSADGSTMIELKSVSVEGDRLKIVGALMGAWDTDMYLDIDGIKAAVGMVDIPTVGKFVVDNVLGITVTKTEE